MLEGGCVMGVVVSIGRNAHKSIAVFVCVCVRAVDVSSAFLVRAYSGATKQNRTILEGKGSVARSVRSSKKGKKAKEAANNKNDKGAGARLLRYERNRKKKKRKKNNTVRRLRSVATAIPDFEVRWPSHGMHALRLRPGRSDCDGSKLGGERRAPSQAVGALPLLLWLSRSVETNNKR